MLLSIAPDKTILELKHEISRRIVTKPGPERQRLIHRGKALIPDSANIRQILGDSLVDDSVKKEAAVAIHLVLRPIVSETGTGEPTRPSQPAAQHDAGSRRFTAGTPVNHQSPQPPARPFAQMPQVHPPQRPASTGAMPPNGIPQMGQPMPPGWMPPHLAALHQNQIIQRQLNEIQQRLTMTTTPANLFHGHATGQFPVPPQGPQWGVPARQPHPPQHPGQDAGEHAHTTQSGVVPLPDFTRVFNQQHQARQDASQERVQPGSGGNNDPGLGQMTGHAQNGISAPLGQLGQTQVPNGGVPPGQSHPAQVWRTTVTHTHTNMPFNGMQPHMPMPIPMSMPMLNPGMVGMNPGIARWQNIAAATQGPPLPQDQTVYLLSSPSGPEALLIGPQGTYSSNHAAPMPPAFGPAGLPDPPIWARSMAQPTRPRSTSPQRREGGQQRRTLRQRLDENHRQLEGLRQRLPEMLGQVRHLEVDHGLNGQGQAPPPAPLMPGQNVPQDDHAHHQLQPGLLQELIRIVVPLGGQLWFLFRLLAIVAVISYNSGWQRTLIVWAVALIMFVAHMGALRPLQERIWVPVRQYVEDLVRLDHNGNGPAARPQGQVGEVDGTADVAGNRERPDPESTARRLLQQHEQRNLWIRVLRNLERSLALFMASLVPGVGERHIAALDAQRAQEDRQRTEEEERVIREAREREDGERMAQDIMPAPGQIEDSPPEPTGASKPAETQANSSGAEPAGVEAVRRRQPTVVNESSDEDGQDSEDGV